MVSCSWAGGVKRTSITLPSGTGSEYATTSAFA